MDLQPVIDALEARAPRRLAGDWDNVGLLVRGTRDVRRLFFAIDLTEPVLAEALQAEADLIVSYHPPIFRGLKRLTGTDPGSRVVLGCVRAGVHVYSPHTALDAAAGGMADWLIGGLGELDAVTPIEPHPDDDTVGAGRMARLATPTPLATLVQRAKDHLALGQVRLAAPAERIDGSAPITTVAVCPGAGGTVLAGARRADLWLTGELRHHDVLGRVARGHAVIVTDHTHTERGFLAVLAAQLGAQLGLQTVVSRVDADPLRIV